MSSRRIRVLEMIDEATLGGGQVHVLSLARHLDPLWFDVEICCEPEGYLVDEARELGVPTHALTVTNDLRLKSLIDTRRLFQSFKWDILHTHGGTAGFWGRLGSLIAQNPGKRVHTYHGIHYLNEHFDAPSRYRLIDQVLLRLTDVLICVCTADFKSGINAGVVDEKKGVIVHNGIEIKKFEGPFDRERVRSELGASSKDFVFGNIGRLHTQKGHEFLIKAFHTVSKKYPEALLWVIGDGELRVHLEGYAEDLGLGGRVSFLGARRDIPELLSAMDAFVLSSLWEGHPIAILEAMAAHKPIIATNVDGVTEILTDGENAFLVPPKAPEALARVMIRMIGEKELRDKLSYTARQTVDSTFGVDTMVKQVSEIYLKVAG